MRGQRDVGATIAAERLARKRQLRPPIANDPVAKRPTTATAKSAPPVTLCIVCNLAVHATTVEEVEHCDYCHGCMHAMCAPTTMVELGHAMLCSECSKRTVSSLAEPDGEPIDCAMRTLHTSVKSAFDRLSSNIRLAQTAPETHDWGLQSTQGRGSDLVELTSTVVRVAPTSQGQFALEPVFCRPSWSEQQQSACVQNLTISTDWQWALGLSWCAKGIPPITDHAAPEILFSIKGFEFNAAWQWELQHVFIGAYVSEAKNGPFVAPLIPVGCSELWLEPHEILSLEADWIKSMTNDIKRYVSPKLGGSRIANTVHRLRSSTLIISIDMLRWPQATIDSLDWQQSNHHMPIRVLTSGSPRRHPHRIGPVLHPYKASRDQEVDDWAMFGVDQCAVTARHMVLATNHKSFYLHADVAVEAVNKDISLGIILPPQSLFTLHPACSDSASIASRVVDGEVTYRKCIDAGVQGTPHMDGADLSRNAGIFLGIHPSLHDVHFPTPVDLACDSAILIACYEYHKQNWVGPNLGTPGTFDPLLGFSNISIESFLPTCAMADMKRWYRQFSVRLSCLWRQFATIHPLGCTSDLGMQFGSRDAVQVAQRRISNILTNALQRIQDILFKWSCWELPVPGLRRDKPPPPHACWDCNPATQQWRTRRYECALKSGLTHAEAMKSTLPCNAYGYIDDAMLPSIALLIDHLLQSVMVDCNNAGILFSLPKFAKVNAKGVKWTMRPDSVHMRISDIALMWASPEPGYLHPLGKELDLQAQRLREKPERIASISKAMLRLTVEAPDGIARFIDLEQILGVLRYIAQTAPAIVPLLQWPTRCLHAQTRFKALGLCPWTNRCNVAFKLIAKIIRRNEGIALCPDRTPINFDTAVWIICDAAGASDEEPDSYRGGFALIVIPGAKHTYWIQRPWTAMELLQHSTALECANGTQALQTLLQQCSPVDIIECFDNSATTGCRRRMACVSPSMCEHVEAFGDVVTHMGRHRLFSLWYPRADIQMADDGSKNDMEAVKRGLKLRGFPDLAPHPWRVKGQLGEVPCEA